MRVTENFTSLRAQNGIAVLLPLLLLSAPVSAATPDAVGGGFAGNGLRGEYYANPKLEGSPSFTRRDVRIDFDWGTTRPVGGSTAEPYRSFPRDAFSVRWAGALIARFGEAYTFHGQADDGVRIQLRAAGAPAWDTIVDRWDDEGAFESKPVQLRAGERYEIRVEYRHEGGPAQLSLRWRSKSTPSEVIDPVRQQGLNFSPHVWDGFIWADAMKGARYGSGSDNVDAAGWPTTSGVEVVLSEKHFPSATEFSGTYLLRFRGQAQVHQDCCNDVVFRAGGQSFKQTLPAGAGYDRATNSTHSVVAIDGSRTMLTFNETRRKPGSSDEGVTGIQLMRPTTQGGSEHHQVDEIAYRPFKRVVEDHYTVLRYLMSAEDVGGVWSERTSPDHPFFIGTNGQPNWEYLVMLANETGSDLYLTIPISANDEYIEKLALLTRYGSDGREPYLGPTPNPVYPPLSSNLRIYVEFDNEIWNWAFGSTLGAARLTKEEHDAGSETWKAIDFDGKAGDPESISAMRRWHAARTVQTSKTFRRIWGDRAMGAKVRTLIEYQYDNYQQTAIHSLDFIDAYYNNRAGEHVSDPHPVSYYIWGGGGAAYYGLKNSTGQQTHTSFEDASFEAQTIEPGTTRERPNGSAWTFKGKAGLIHPVEGEAMKGFDNLTATKAGKQAAFLRGTGSISQRIRFEKPGHYAIAFSGAGIADGWPPYQPFDILVDNRKVSPRDQNDPRVSPETAVIGGFSRALHDLKAEWGSAVFYIDSPGSHTITFVGRDPDPNFLVIDAVRIASADAITTSGFGKGEAFAQDGDPDLAYQLRTQARYARSFGLQVVAYESGWSLGGDFDQSPVQNWTKLEDPRATAINDEAMKIWDESGSFLTIWGVYRYWPRDDFAGAGNYPVMKSYRAASERLPHEPTYGRSLPATLLPGDADWSHRNEALGWRKHIPCLNAVTDQWLSWMLLAPHTGTYSVQLEGSGDGRWIVEVDGDPIGELSSLGDSESKPLDVMLTEGAHSIRVILVGDDLELRRVAIRPVER